jgi:hypothetical protein
MENILLATRSTVLRKLEAQLCKLYILDTARNLKFSHSHWVCNGFEFDSVTLHSKGYLFTLALSENSLKLVT